jgi:NAD(P)-dependent dehydrogenase (short-subunit alcohol dehydrogenase family)
MGWWEQRSGLSGTAAVVTGGAGGLGEACTLDLVGRARAMSAGRPTRAPHRRPLVRIARVTA